MKTEKSVQITSTDVNKIIFDVKKIKRKVACNPECQYDITAYPPEYPKGIKVNTCSSVYELIPNSLIFPEIEEILDSYGIEYTKEYRMINWSRFYCEYVITDPRFVYEIKGSNGDFVQPRLSAQHSYNGLVMYGFHFGYFRMICANGVVIAVNEMNEFNLSIKGKHTINSLNDALKQLTSKIKYFVDNGEQITTAITAKYDVLAGNKVTNLKDRVTEALSVLNLKEQTKKLNDGTEKKSFPAYDAVMETIENEISYYNGIANDWLVYNGINAYIFDEKFKASPDARTKKDSKVFEFLLFN